MGIGRGRSASFPHPQRPFHLAKVEEGAKAISGNKWQIYDDEADVDIMWDKLGDVIRTATKESFPRVPKKDEEYAKITTR